MATKPTNKPTNKRKITTTSVEEVSALEERFAQLVSGGFGALAPKVEEVKALAAKLLEHGGSSGGGGGGVWQLFACGVCIYVE